MAPGEDMPKGWSDPNKGSGCTRRLGLAHPVLVLASVPTATAAAGVRAHPEKKSCRWAAPGGPCLFLFVGACVAHIVCVVYRVHPSPAVLVSLLVRGTPYRWQLLLSRWAVACGALLAFDAPISRAVLACAR